MTTVIYDFGSNNGDDIPYYLLKSDKVVAVEANPVLASRIRTRFSREILEGRVTIVNCAVAINESKTDTITFYVHKRNDHLSTLVTPPASQLSNFEPISIGTKDPVEIVSENGSPYFVKIDIEHYDHLILARLFAAGIFPEFISSEFQDVRVIAQILSCGIYRSFNIVEGHNVGRVYKNAQIKTNNGDRAFSFPAMSAGPFGEDITSPWMSPKSVFLTAANRGLGWRDIHASRTFAPVTDECVLEEISFARRVLLSVCPPIGISVARSALAIARRIMKKNSAKTL